MSEKTLTFESYISKVFVRVAIGLLISAITSLAFVYSLFYSNFMAQSYSIILIGSCIAELFVVFYFSRKLNTMSKDRAWMCYIGYAILTGISLSSILLSYGQATCFIAFGYTAIMFVCMALIGKSTKINLLNFGGLFTTGLISSIVLSLVNSLIFHSSSLDMIIAYLGIFIFLGLIAYDTRRLYAYFDSFGYDNDTGEKIAIYGAFELYLDFINLFLKLLNILTRNKKSRD